LIVLEHQQKDLLGIVDCFGSSGFFLLLENNWGRESSEGCDDGDYYEELNKCEALDYFFCI